MCRSIRHRQILRCIPLPREAPRSTPRLLMSPGDRQLSPRCMLMVTEAGLSGIENARRKRNAESTQTPMNKSLKRSLGKRSCTLRFPPPSSALPCTTLNERALRMRRLRRPHPFVMHQMILEYHPVKHPPIGFPPRPRYRLLRRINTLTLIHKITRGPTLSRR